MTMSFSAIMMSISALFILIMIFFLRKDKQQSVKIGLIAWIALSAYFFVEYLVIRATTAPYHFLMQPMSDLGVTICGKNTYVLATYDICSPYHLLMNWTFTFTGLAICAGAILLGPCWPKTRKMTIAIALLIIYGLSYSISGIFPADKYFLIHTLGSLPGMVVQIPALWLIIIVIRNNMPALANWTLFCLLCSTIALLLLFFQPVFPGLPGGLLQRILYGSVFVWLPVTAVALWRKQVSMTNSPEHSGR